MLTRFALTIAAAAMFVGSSGCACWNHMWGSWAYYGDCNTYGYNDGCPAGPCAGGCGSEGCCNGLGVYPPPGAYCGMYGECGGCCDAGNCGEGCGHGCGLFGHGGLLGLGILHSPGPVGPWACSKGGCGELYVCDWYNHPPTCDPCDYCGNYVGCMDPRPCYQATPRYGSVWLHGGPGVYGEPTGGQDIGGAAPEELEMPTPPVERRSAPSSTDRGQLPSVQRKRLPSAHNGAPSSPRVW